MTKHSQEYLDSLSKQQRGEIWIKSVLAKQPDYDVQALQNIWEQTENTHETYEQEADKIKFMLDGIAEAKASGFITYDSIEEAFDSAWKRAVAEVKAEKESSVA